MADDMDDIEDMLEAPYKNAAAAPHADKTEAVNGTSNGAKTNGDDEHHKSPSNDAEMPEEKTEKTDKVDKSEKSSENHKESSKSKESSKKSRKDRSRSRSRDSKHRKRSRSHSKSKKSKRSRSRERDKDKSTHDRDRKRSGDRERKRSSERDRKRRSRSSDRDRKRRSRSRSSHRRRGHRSRSRDDSRSRRRRHSRSPPPKREKSPELTPEERDVRTVFVMQLSNRIRPIELEDFFSSVGKVRDVRLITDPRTKRSKGIAYIEFRDVDSVPLAIALTGQRLLGVPLIVKLTQAEKNRMPLQLPNQGTAIIPQNGPMKLYIGSLHVNITEDMLRGIFEPFGKIEQIVLSKDDFGRSKGYGFIQFENADDAKKAMEQLNNFELANRPMKVAPFIEKPLDGNASISNLDNDELDRTGVNLGPSGKLALMAKLAEGSGIKLPQYTIDALNNMSTAAAAAQAERTNGSAAAAPQAPTASQCFLLSNMFDLAEEMQKSNWVDEIRDDVIEECSKYGGVVHVSIDQFSPDGNIFIKCPTIAIALAAMAGLNGRYFAGRVIKASFIQLATYHQQFPEAVNCAKILKAVS